MTTKKTKIGRPSLFGPKDGDQIHAVLTKRGSVLFEMARRALAKLTKKDPDAISDGNAMEFVLRGEAESRKALGVEPK